VALALLAGGCATDLGTFRETADLKPYDGRPVRLHGVIDGCEYGACRLCPDWDALRDHIDCTEFYQWRDPHPQTFYRLSEVTLTATVRWLEPVDEANADCMQDTGLCFGLLRHVAVAEVTERRAATELKLSTIYEPIAPADGATDAKLRALFAADPRISFDTADAAGIRTFVYDDHVSDIEGHLCGKRAPWRGVANFAWPARYVDLLPNPANRYFCLKAVRPRDGSWRIERDDPDQPDLWWHPP
jgi:hypothetical protein